MTGGKNASMTCEICNRFAQKTRKELLQLPGLGYFDRKGHFHFHQLLYSRYSLVSTPPETRFLVNALFNHIRFHLFVLLLL